MLGTRRYPEQYARVYPLPYDGGSSRALHWQPALTVATATVLMIESLVFVWVHAKYGEIIAIMSSSVLVFLWRSPRSARRS